MFTSWAAALSFAVLALAGRSGRPRPPRGRWLALSVVLALVVALPTVPSLWRPLGHRSELVDGAAVHLMPAAMLLLMALQLVRLPRALRPFLAGAAPAAAVAEVAAIAARLGMPVPVVLQLRAGTATTVANAFATGTLQPTLLLGDGIMVRLSADQRAAVYAHELAHVRGWHVFFRVLALAAAWFLVLSFTTGASSGIVIALLVGSSAFVTTVVAHRQERGADAVAARCVGAPAMAAGLDVIHAANRMLLPFAGDALFHAVATHPANVVRAAALFPDDAGLRRQARRFERARAVLLTLWAMALAGALIASPGSRIQTGAVVVAVLPCFASLLLLRRFASLRRELRQLGWIATRPRWYVVLCLSGLAVVLLAQPLGLGTIGVLLGVACLWSGLLLLLAERLMRRRLIGHLARGDLHGHLQRFGRLTARRRRRVDLVLEAANVRAAAGDHEGALAAMAALGDHPGARYGRAVLLQRRDAAAARTLLSPLAERWPGNAMVQMLLADVEARLGDHAAAFARSERVARARPEEGTLLAIAARVARLAGAAERAAELLAAAERLAPGEPATVTERALRDVAVGAPTAGASLQRLRELHAAAPLALLGDALGEVEAAIAAGVQHAGP